MRFPSRRLLAAGLPAAGLCVWAVYVAALVGEAPAPGERSSAGAPPAPGPPAPVSPGPSALVLPAAADRTPTPAPASAELDAGAARSARILLRLVILGEPPAETGSRVTVWSAWPSEQGLRTSWELDLGLDLLAAEPGSSGQTRQLDVSSLFLFAEPAALVLRVTSGDDSGLAVVPSGQPEEGLEARIWLDAGVLCRGVVEPPEARRVGAFLVMDGAPTSMSLGQGEVHPDGSFELQLPGGNEYAFCAFGTGRPGTLLAHLGFGPGESLPTLFLPPEMAIEGGLDLPGSWESATVSAAPVAGRGHYAVGGGEFTWLAGAFEWASRVATLTPDGRLRLSGLAPDWYELRIMGARTHSRAAVGRLPTLEVRAPASGVDLAPRMARVRLRLERDGAPVQADRIALIQDFGRGGSSHLQAAADSRGVAEFWLDPDAPAWVQGGEHARFLPRELDARAPHTVQVGR